MLKLFTDTDCDVTPESAAQYGYGLISMPYAIDGRTVYDKAMYDAAVQLCEAQGIAWQTKTKIAGGNDAGAIQNAGQGARVLAVSVPCRYLHAPASVIRLSDADACEQLAFALVSALQEQPL